MQQEERQRGLWDLCRNMFVTGIEVPPISAPPSGGRGQDSTPRLYIRTLVAANLNLKSRLAFGCVNSSSLQTHGRRRRGERSLGAARIPLRQPLAAVWVVAPTPEPVREPGPEKPDRWRKLVGEEVWNRRLTVLLFVLQVFPSV